MGPSARRTGVALLKTRLPQRVGKALRRPLHGVPLRGGRGRCTGCHVHPVGAQFDSRPACPVPAVCARHHGGGPNRRPWARRRRHRTQHSQHLAVLYAAIHPLSVEFGRNRGPGAFILVGVLISLMVGHLRESLLSIAPGGGHPAAQDTTGRSFPRRDHHRGFEPPYYVVERRGGGDLWLDGKRSPRQSHPRFSAHHERDFDRGDRRDSPSRWPVGRRIEPRSQGRSPSGSGEPPDAGSG